MRGEEIKNLKTIENIKEYIYCHINGLEQGIIKTYDEDNNKSFEEFGLYIESMKLPLQSILQCINIENNIHKFK